MKKRQKYMWVLFSHPAVTLQRACRFACATILIAIAAWPVVQPFVYANQQESSLQRGLKASHKLYTGRLNSLVKIAPVNPSLYKELSGNYEIASNRVVSIGPFSEAGDRPVFYDSGTRRFGVLYAISENEFLTGTPGENDMLAPADLRLVFLRNQQNRVIGLSWREGENRVLRGKKVSPHRDEEVTFTNGDVVLRGTLTVPETGGPHPVIILLQEAGPRRRPFGMWPYLFAGHGIEMLTFDKRGSGASNGNWQTASFEDFAGDVLSAIKFLQSRKEIDPRQIGLWGNSNSGWVTPLVASRSRDVAFIINRVGSSLTPTENILYEIENQMRGQSYSEDEISKAVSLRRMLQEAIVSNSGWEHFIAAAAAARNERWFALSRTGRYASSPLPPNDLTLQEWRKPLAFDPIPYWERVTCPVLALYGEQDTNTPTIRNVPPLINALKQAGNKDFTIRVFPGTDHLFYEYRTNHGDYVADIPAMQRLVPGYVDEMINWLSRRLVFRH